MQPSKYGTLFSPNKPFFKNRILHYHGNLSLKGGYPSQLFTGVEKTATYALCKNITLPKSSSDGL